MTQKAKFLFSLLNTEEYLNSFWEVCGLTKSGRELLLSRMVALLCRTGYASPSRSGALHSRTAPFRAPPRPGGHTPVNDSVRATHFQKSKKAPALEPENHLLFFYRYSFDEICLDMSLGRYYNQGNTFY